MSTCAIGKGGNRHNFNLINCSDNSLTTTGGCIESSLFKNISTELLLSQNGLPDDFVFSYLDEPLFLKFGGERIRRLMEQLGIYAYEEISYTPITKSILNAQGKIAKKISFEKKQSIGKSGLI
ncbi:MAG TPA: hypothetical protein VFM99_05825 [Chitinophagales bacterium]|nr:hypothetical protein [Chitinophagales bacterium]